MSLPRDGATSAHDFTQQERFMADETENENITEEVKWNAPSFRTDDHFATLRLHPPKSLQLILHTGAKVKSHPKAFTIDDPAGLLKWPAGDRAVMTLTSTAELQRHKDQVLRILRQWVAQL